MKIEIQIHTKDEKPKETEYYKDKFLNPKQTNYIVWDADNCVRFAVFHEGKFCHAQNKKPIQGVELWMKVPRDLVNVEDKK